MCVGPTADSPLRKEKLVLYQNFMGMIYKFVVLLEGETPNFIAEEIP